MSSELLLEYPLLVFCSVSKARTVSPNLVQDNGYRFLLPHLDIHAVGNAQR